MVAVINPDDPKYAGANQFQLPAFDYKTLAVTYNAAQVLAILTVAKSQCSQTSVINALKRRGLDTTVDVNTYQDETTIYVKKLTAKKLQVR